jgi:hypothetical protein
MKHELTHRFDRIKSEVNKEQIDFGKLRVELGKLKAQVQQYKKSAKDDSKTLHRLKKIEEGILEMLPEIVIDEIVQKLEKSMNRYVQDIEEGKSLKVHRSDAVAMINVFSQFVHSEAVKSEYYAHLLPSFEMNLEICKQSLSQLDEAMKNEDGQKKYLKQLRDPAQLALLKKAQALMNEMCHDILDDTATSLKSGLLNS